MAGIFFVTNITKLSIFLQKYPVNTNNIYKNDRHFMLHSTVLELKNKNYLINNYDSILVLSNNIQKQKHAWSQSIILITIISIHRDADAIR